MFVLVCMFGGYCIKFSVVIDFEFYGSIGYWLIFGICYEYGIFGSWSIIVNYVDFCIIWSFVYDFFLFGIVFEYFCMYQYIMIGGSIKLIQV